MNPQPNSSNRETNSIEQGNRLIAEFMGLEVCKVKDYSTHDGTMYALFGHPEAIYFGASGTLLKDAKYHSSWDWLIPVADDIYYSRRFHTGAQTTEISSPRYRLWKEIEKGLLHFSIDQTWQAVVKFIEFHNSRKPVEAIKAATQTIAEGVEILNSVMNDAVSDTTGGEQGTKS